MNDPFEIYAAQREKVLGRIVETMSKDERFVAAWLTGSFARHEQDALSDLDLTVVVSDPHSKILCERPRQVSAQTTKERYELFSLFGQPAILHENNNNAPEGGTFTFVMYAETAIVIDWILRPQSTARRPSESILLWDNAGISMSLPGRPDPIAKLIEEASEKVAFFWMMAAITVKYIIRGDGVFVNTWLEELHKLVYEVDRCVAGEVWRYKRGSFSVLENTPQGQLSALRRLSEQMAELMPEVVRLGGHVPAAPMATIEILINMANVKN
jgi:predicted nucleotidyltransferase